MVVCTNRKNRHVLAAEYAPELTQPESTTAATGGSPVDGEAKAEAPGLERSTKLPEKEGNTHAEGKKNYPPQFAKYLEVHIKGNGHIHVLSTFVRTHTYTRAHAFMNARKQEHPHTRTREHI